ncbi:MAG: AIR synthase-related protein, partial [Oscillospiraceae bacterium]|nr:AIR synthase-related protein [Oscillospiraceae bacterium]
MRDTVYRCYVEKRPGFDSASRGVQKELSAVLRLPGVRVRLFHRYDAQGLPEESWPPVMNTVCSEPMCDDCYEDDLPPLPDGARLLPVEPLPGQFDLRADSCAQCIQMLLGGRRPLVRTAAVYAVEGVSDADFERVKAYLINPVECREASPGKPDTLTQRDESPPGDIPVIHGFTALDADGLDALRLRLGLAMSRADMRMIRDCFRGERRDPTLTELRVLDTYWSDHCRHTTFNTAIQSADIRDRRVEQAFRQFVSVNGERPVTLMNIAAAAARAMRAQGKLPMLDLSDEINACTVRVDAEFTHGREDWLLFFKNETHNHPTEIEPYGGAATCIGGAIRDPLSGRAYVYQSMRITGAGDPRKPMEDTLEGKLPQRKIVTAAAGGFSAYGNQIGLATGYVREFYHEGYIAKRLEAGAVVGAAPASRVRRECPAPGDLVAVLGGRTGRDGIGGATGSSKTHGTDTVSQCASEVQKGNAPEERKLQRLFRDPDVTRLIKRCNDFGAGGAAVAIGELADGVEIVLDALPVKYQGLDGTELAISESQERMAVVVAKLDFQELK